MSALTKPLIHTVNSDVALTTPINAEMVHTIGTMDAPKLGDNGKDKYYINFSILGTDNQVKDVSWKYSLSATAQADRDADFAAVVALISTAV